MQKIPELLDNNKNNKKVYCKLVSLAAELADKSSEN